MFRHRDYGGESCCARSRAMCWHSSIGIREDRCCIDLCLLLRCNRRVCVVRSRGSAWCVWHIGRMPMVLRHRAVPSLRKDQVPIYALQFQDVSSTLHHARRCELSVHRQHIDCGGFRIPLDLLSRHMWLTENPSHSDDSSLTIAGQNRAFPILTIPCNLRRGSRDCRTLSDM